MKKVSPSNLLAEIEKACSQARDPKIQSQTKKLQALRKRLKEKYKREFTKEAIKILEE